MHLQKVLGHLKEINDNDSARAVVLVVKGWLDDTTHSITTLWSLRVHMMMANRSNNRRLARYGTLYLRRFWSRIALVFSVRPEVELWYIVVNGIFIFFVPVNNKRLVSSIIRQSNYDGRWREAKAIKASFEDELCVSLNDDGRSSSAPLGRLPMQKCRPRRSSPIWPFLRQVDGLVFESVVHKCTITSAQIVRMQKIFVKNFPASPAPYVT